MSDKAFEYSLITLTCLVIVWVVIGIVVRLLGTAWIVIIGLVIEFIGGILLYYWDKNYVSRT